MYFILHKDMTMTVWQWLWGLLIHMCIVEHCHHWFWWWLGICWTPSHYLNQYRLTFNWPPPPSTHPSFYLTHWGRVTHICVSKLTIIGSDNGLSPDRRQAIIWTNAGILLIGPLGTNFSEILFEILIFSFKKMLLNVSSGKWRPFFSASMC